MLLQTCSSQACSPCHKSIRYITLREQRRSNLGSFFSFCALHTSSASWSSVDRSDIWHRQFETQWRLKAPGKRRANVCKTWRLTTEHTSCVRTWTWSAGMVWSSPTPSWWPASSSPASPRAMYSRQEEYLTFGDCGHVWTFCPGCEKLNKIQSKHQMELQLAVCGLMMMWMSTIIHTVILNCTQR